MGKCRYGYVKGTHRCRTKKGLVTALQKGRRRKKRYMPAMPSMSGITEED